MSSSCRPRSSSFIGRRGREAPASASDTGARCPHVSDVNVALPLPRFPSARGVAPVAPLRAERSQVTARAPSSCLSPSSPGHFSWLLLFGPAKRSDPDAGRRSEARRRRATWRKAFSKESDPLISRPVERAAGEHPGGRPPAKEVLEVSAGQRKPAAGEQPHGNTPASTATSSRKSASSENRPFNKRGKPRAAESSAVIAVRASHHRSKRARNRLPPPSLRLTPRVA